jgi:DNA replication factor GINS
MDTVGNDPFAKEQYLLRDTQRIATEICERREHKITDSAVMNIQRSYHLFKGKPQFDLQDTTPLNLTPEEEQLYFSLIDTLRGYRGKIIPSLDVLEENPSITAKEITNDEVISSKETTPETQISPSKLKDNLNNIKAKTQGQEIPSFPEVESKSDKKVFKGEISFSDDLKDVGGEEFSPPVKPEDLSRSKSKPEKRNVDLKTVVIFDELPSIVGVDEKVYGPFCPQDVVKMPEINAQLFIKARKGRYIKS